MESPIDRLPHLKIECEFSGILKSFNFNRFDAKQAFAGLAGFMRKGIKLKN
jgi:hypothetical protein